MNITVIITAITSATTMDAQIPSRSKNMGIIKTAATWNKRVRRKEITAEVSPSFNAVKNPDPKIAKPLVKHLFENGCEWAHVQTNFYCRVFADEKNCTKKGEYTLETMPDVPYFSQINTQLPTFEESAKVTASVNEAFGEELNPLQNGECLDIVRKDINKAVGLYKLAEILSAKKEDIIAVGDNINDTHMIAEFRSYAMENAVDSIKELADFVTPSVTDLIEKELSE